jgi:hypothetical protein
MKCKGNIPDCFAAVKQIVRMPIVIVILMNVMAAMTMLTEFGIDQRKRFLTKKAT